MSLLRGDPTCRLLATRRSLEREILSWKLPVTFEFELEPGLETLIARWQYARDVRLRPLDHQADSSDVLRIVPHGAIYETNLRLQPICGAIHGMGFTEFQDSCLHRGCRHLMANLVHFCNMNHV